MVAFKASQLTGFLKEPDPRFRAALFYGPEPGQVADHAATLARRVAADSPGEAEIIRVDDRDLIEAPDRILVEAKTTSMFSDLKIIRVTAGARVSASDLERVIEDSGRNWLIVEGGNLRPDSKLRKLFEQAAAAAALPCYELGARDMERFIDDALGVNGVTVEPDARRHLVVLFSGDQARARQELEKVSLYVGDGNRVTLDDVDAAIGDVALGAYDTLCATAGDGRRREALRQLDRLIASGQSPQAAIAALARHFERLHRLCAAAESGTPLRAALSAFRPPLHFRQRDVLEAQATRWSRAAAGSALRLIGRSAVAARTQPNLERLFAERVVLALSGKPLN